MFCPACASPVSRRASSCAACSHALSERFWAELDHATAAPPDDLGSSRLGLFLESRYRVEHALGAGGMGEVFRGVDVRLERAVAVKFLAKHARSNAALVERF